MNRVNFFSLLMAGLILGGCATTPRQKQLKMRDINLAMIVLEDTEFDAVAGKNIMYREIGIDKYDEFFKEAAICYGGMATAEVMLERTLATLENNKGRGLNVAKKAKMVANLGLAITGLAFSIKTAATLIPQAVQLVQDAPSDLKGSCLSPTDPEVIREIETGLRQSAGTLNRIYEEGPGLLEKMKKLYAELK